MKRRWLLWLLAILFAWIVVSRLTEIESLARTLATGRWQDVLVSALLQVAYYTAIAFLYWSAFDTVDVRSQPRELLPLVFASVFVNVAAPSQGASGTALFIDDAVRRGQSAARATAGALLSWVAELSAFMPILFTGVAYLFLRHDLHWYEVAGALVLLLVLGGSAGVLLLGLWRPDWLLRLLRGVQKLVNWVAAHFKHVWLPEGWAQENASEFTQAALAATAHPRRLSRTLLVGITAHLLDLLSLYALFQAFRQSVSLGVLVAAYTMGIVFWIISIIPQGIGVVEGMMALVSTSLGIPAASATLIALAYRGLTFWLPFVAGFFALRRVKVFAGPERHSREPWAVHAVALLTALTGAINVLSAVTPSVLGRMRWLETTLPLEIRHGSRLTATLAGFALLLLAGNLWRRKRAAWLLTLFVLLISAASHMFKGLDYEEAALALALAAWLFSLRPHFHARSDRPSMAQGLRALAMAGGFTLVYGTAGFYLLERHFAVNGLLIRFSLSAALRQTVVMFTQFYDPGLEPITGLGRYFAASIYTVGAVTLGYALWMLVRPVLVRAPASPAERARAEGIVQAFGHSSLARLALLDDKLFHFTPGGSVIAYALRGRVALALGDPIGPPEDSGPAIASFRGTCAANDWLPAFYQTLPDYLESYRAAGMDALSIGDEAIVDLATFGLEGKAQHGLRAAVNRVTKLGYRAEVLEPPLNDEMLTELREISDEWLTLMHGGEMRFSVGWFEDDYIRNGQVMLVRGPQNDLVAFANLVPEYKLNEATIDLMRHNKRAPSGTMEFLFVSLFRWATAHGYATFNLGLSALINNQQTSDSPPIERALHYIYEHVDQFYNFHGLHEFKAKFRPNWSPRYLIYPGTASLPAVAMALIQANAGQDFPWEYFRR